MTYLRRFYYDTVSHDGQIMLDIIRRVGADRVVMGSGRPADMGYERKTSIPTAGVVVKTCLDGCSACEPNLEKKIELELAHLELQNKLLARQIELLEKSQEYRCCPESTDKG